jgi:hypothetical protein
MTDQDAYRKFVQSVIDNVKKNGFPEKRVAFPLEKMYEFAENKGINFNKVLETLDSIQIAHEKTPEKIVFYPKDRMQKTPPTPVTDDPPPGIDPDLFSNIDPAMLGNMNLQDVMSAASSMLENMTPEQLESIKSVYENMSDEDREALMEQMKKLGFF